MSTSIIDVPTSSAPAVAQRPHGALVLAAGCLGGAALGVVARAWMRVIAEDPAFTWSGTLFIVGGFAFFGTTQAIVAVARRRVRRRWLLTMVRMIGIVGMLPLFTAAGAVMAPTVICGGLAAARVDWPVAVRWVMGVLAGAPVVLIASTIVSDATSSGRSVVGVVGLVAVYTALATATAPTLRPQQDGWRLPRPVRIVGMVVGVAVLGLAAVGLAGISG
jgi:hypothetical protein